MQSCTGCKKALYKKYRAATFGIPTHDDNELFKCLSLKIFQTGLNEQVIANKKAEIDNAFDHFHIQKVASYKEDKIQELLANENIIRYAPKIRAIIHNANQVLLIQKKHQSFANFLWHFTRNEPLNYDSNPDSLIPPLQIATTISIALKNEGFKFVGPKTVLGFLHMIGIIQAKNICIYK